MKTSRMLKIRVHACGDVIENLNCTILLDWNQSEFSYCEVDQPHLKTISYTHSVEACTIAIAIYSCEPELAIAILIV